MIRPTLTALRRSAIAFGALVAFATAPAAADLPDRITLDWAYYNPVSLILKDNDWLEQELGGEVEIRWVQSHGSNRSLEYLNARSVDFGSTAGAAALLGKIYGNPIKAIYIYSKPEWTALVTRPDTGIASVADLAGKRVAVTRGTDPYIFLLRALAANGMSERDIRPVLLQHPDGGVALIRGDVDAWAGLDPMMAQHEIDSGAHLFFRDADLNTYGFLNVREDFANQYPEAVEAVIRGYERARIWAQENPEELTRILKEAANLSDEVAARQIERTDLTNPEIGQVHLDAIVSAGTVLQEAGVIEADVDVRAVAEELVEPRYSERVFGN